MISNVEELVFFVEICLGSSKATCETFIYIFMSLDGFKYSSTITSKVWNLLKGFHEK